MKKEEIEVYSHATNSCVVRMPERNFPGVVIQGDTLSTIYTRLLDLLENTEGKVEEDTFLGILELAEDIEAHLMNYKNTLIEHEIELPFIDDENKNTKKYQKYWDE